MNSRLKLQVYGELLVDGLRKQLSSVRKLFDSGDPGLSYWNNLVFTGDGPDAHSKLPTIVLSGSMSPNWEGFDSTTVGNVIFCARILDPPVEVSSAGDEYVFDRFRFTTYFLLPGDGGNGYHLYSCESEDMYLDYDQVVTILNSEPTSPQAVVDSLISQGLDIAWRVNATTANTAFYQVTTGLADANPINHTIVMKEAERMSGFASHSGSHRHAIAANGRGLSQLVPKFAVQSFGFPNGFEILILGPQSGRKVMVRIVLVGEGYGIDLAIEHLAYISVNEY